ncbi:MAG TPA: type II toxin-antitoxin system VapC family toxin [Rhizobiaceae bacterium]|nr:type II toxin-antitoxin system VapC family toxin [Rhizobiaceae bacterium]
MTLVVDASLIIAAVMPDEDSEIASTVLDRIADEGAVAPGIFTWEVANVLSIAIRRKRLSFQDAEDILEDLADLDIVCEATEAGRVRAEVFGLSQRHALSVYDAGYLELARRLNAPLATLDRQLARAGRAEGVDLVSGIE